MVAVDTEGPLQDGGRGVAAGAGQPERAASFLGDGTADQRAEDLQSRPAGTIRCALKGNARITETKFLRLDPAWPGLGEDADRPVHAEQAIRDRAAGQGQVGDGLGVPEEEEAGSQHLDVGVGWMELVGRLASCGGERGVRIGGADREQSACGPMMGLGTAVLVEAKDAGAEVGSGMAILAGAPQFDCGALQGEWATAEESDEVDEWLGGTCVDAGVGGEPEGTAELMGGAECPEGTPHGEGDPVPGWTVAGEEQRFAGADAGFGQFELA